MSIHRSLVAKGALVRSRNVLKRYERIQQLRRVGRWSDDESPYGLPKVRVLRLKKRGKEKKKKAEEEKA
ncbi:MAG: small basic protein [Planctomycetes bacterium]|nr:small basic protein [Planctomycetota bacterium]